MFKKYCISFISIVLALLLTCSGIVYIVDPFNVYRADADMTKIIYQNPFYQNIGIAKHTQYDTLITGSSMTQNFRAWWFDEAFNCQAIRLSFDGGYIPDYVLLLKASFESHPNLKTVYFGLDNYLITTDTDLTEHPSKIPSYQTDNNPFSNVKYLLNKDVLFNNMRIYFAYKNYPDYDFYEMNAWGALERDPSVFNAKNVLKTVSPIESKPALATDIYAGYADELYEAFEPFLLNYPDTQFVFFAPPYSILYWYGLRQEGKLNATIYALQKMYEQLLSNDNVRIFYFQEDIDLITDLEQYKDFSHYCTDYNRFMLDCFQDGKHEVTKETYKESLKTMQDTVEKYDFDTLFTRQNQ